MKEKKKKDVLFVEARKFGFKVGKDISNKVWTQIYLPYDLYRLAKEKSLSTRRSMNKIILQIFSQKDLERQEFHPENSYTSKISLWIPIDIAKRIKTIRKKEQVIFAGLKSMDDNDGR